MKKNVLITGGAGFIGCNCAKYYIERGNNVVIIDNLSRKGTKENLDWLKNFGEYVFYKADITNFGEIEKIFSNIDIPDYIFHFAGQVAVTLSIKDPRHDLINNIVGTYNLLDISTKYAPEAVFLYSSTNKVYGNLTKFEYEEDETCYRLKKIQHGISEDTPLDFFSPYGCSKGAADQYVLDFYRIFKLKTIVFRQSCIYGFRQLGIEDQGWVAWFIISAVKNREITVYGNGKQVRDLLFVDDLISAFDSAISNSKKTAGQAYNIGGGPGSQTSLLDFISLLESLLDQEVAYRFANWRDGDQLYYVSDISKAKRDFGWFPSIKINEGIKKMINWVKNNKKLFYYA